MIFFDNHTFVGLEIGSVVPAGVRNPQHLAPVGRTESAAALERAGPTCGNTRTTGGGGWPGGSRVAVDASGGGGGSSSRGERVSQGPCGRCGCCAS